MLAWLRRRKQNRQRLARWAEEEALRAPPYVAWPGYDPFAEPERDGGGGSGSGGDGSGDGDGDGDGGKPAKQERPELLN